MSRPIRTRPDPRRARAHELLMRINERVIDEPSSDYSEIARAMRLLRLVGEAVRAGVPQSEAIIALYPDVYTEDP